MVNIIHNMSVIHFVNGSRVSPDAFSVRLHARYHGPVGEVTVCMKI
jgi:hypothetical protein